jgi:dihydrolipoamide dehydrogenase
MTKPYDVVVIGAGPAGYVAAIRCAQLGLNTACVDRWLDRQGRPVLGGTCLNAGCIPSKTLLESSEFFDRLRNHAREHGITAAEVTVDVAEMVSRKDDIVRDLTSGIAVLFKANGITWLPGRGRLLPDRKVQITAHDGKETVIAADHVILATGSAPMELSAAPLQDERIVDSAGALDWNFVSARVGIIGAGVIGLELGSVWRRLGSEVILLEAQDVFLAMVDQQVARVGLKAFREQGLDIRLGALLKDTRITDEGVELDYQDKKGPHSLTVDRLVVAVGRRPYTEGLAAPETGLLLDEGGFIHVDEQGRTNLPGVYAVGDVVRGAMLAHRGSEEGIAVAERITGQASEVNYEAIASVIYTQPEIAWVGKTEEALKMAGTAYRCGVFPFAASGRAKAMGVTTGLVKTLSDAESDRLLGVHIIGPLASELVGQAVTAMEFGGSAEDVARTVFAHPTLSEALHESALAIDNRAIHVAVRRGEKTGRRSPP